MRFRAACSRAAALLCLAGAACSEPPRPWEAEGQRGAEPRLVTPSATSSPASSAAETGEAPTVAGGLFGRCAEGFVAPPDPLVALTKLTLSCGPSTGMEPLGDGPTEGAVADDAPSVRLPISLRAGTCYRIFAVAGEGVEELTVEVRSSRDVVIASDNGAGRVAIVHGDRPVCPPADDDVVVQIAAAKGRGAFALEVWKLPAH